MLCFEAHKKHISKKIEGISLCSTAFLAEFLFLIFSMVHSAVAFAIALHKFRFYSDRFVDCLCSIAISIAASHRAQIFFAPKMHMHARSHHRNISIWTMRANSQSQRHRQRHSLLDSRSVALFPSHNFFSFFLKLYFFCILPVLFSRHAMHSSVLLFALAFIYMNCRNQVQMKCVRFSIAKCTWKRKIWAKEKNRYTHSLAHITKAQQLNCNSLCLPTNFTRQKIVRETTEATENVPTKDKEFYVRRRGNTHTHARECNEFIIHWRVCTIKWIRMRLNCLHIIDQVMLLSV